MKELLDKIVKFLQKVFKELRPDKRDKDRVTPDTPKPDIKPEGQSPTERPAPAVPGMPPGSYIGTRWHAEDPYYNYEPPSTGKVGEVTSFLWKPHSENTGNPVVLVSCDDVPRGELFIEIMKKNGKPFRLKSNKAFSRANKLDRDKYGRISFRLGLSINTYRKNSPIRVKFFQEVNGVRKYIKVMGKPSLVISNPENRLEKR